MALAVHICLAKLNAVGMPLLMCLIKCLEPQVIKVV